ncbi:hypothetical protein [Peribacillus simplex]
MEYHLPISFTIHNEGNPKELHGHSSCNERVTNPEER